MAELTLVIGNKNYSSWSLRPWLLLKQAGIAFREIYIPTHTAQTRAAILEHSPAGRVPVLHDGSVTVWESLAICEYLAEQFPDKQLWPTDRGARALARSVATEMHAGFGALRSNMVMNSVNSTQARLLHPRSRPTSSAYAPSGTTAANVTAAAAIFCLADSASPTLCMRRWPRALRPTASNWIRLRALTAILF